jgi:hypothetical protein
VVFTAFPEAVEPAMVVAIPVFRPVVGIFKILFPDVTYTISKSSTAIPSGPVTPVLHSVLITDEEPKRTILRIALFRLSATYILR